VSALLLEKYPQEAAVYVTLGNTLAAAGQWSEARRVRQLMDARGVKKSPGVSWIEIDGNVHQFRMNEREHPEASLIHAKWREVQARIEENGYASDTSWVMQNVAEHERKEILSRHSEKMPSATAC
jgi:hypothetical protein